MPNKSKPEVHPHVTVGWIESVEQELVLALHDLMAVKHITIGQVLADPLAILAKWQAALYRMDNAMMRAHTAIKEWRKERQGG